MKRSVFSSLLFTQTRNFLLAGFVLFLLVGAAQIYSLSQSLYRDTAHTVRFVMDAGSEKLREVLRRRDGEAMSNVVDGFLVYPFVQKAWLVDHSGEVLAESASPSKATGNGAFYGLEGVLWDLQAPITHTVFLKSSGQAAGAVSITLSRRYLQTKLSEGLFFGSALLLPCIILLALLSCLTTFHSIIRPLRRAAKAVAAVDASDPELKAVPALPPHEHDEIGLLLGNVNTLLTQTRTVMTALKSREKELSLARERYRSIFDNAVEGVFQTTLEGKVLAFNPVARQLFGFSEGDEPFDVVDIGEELYADPVGREEFKNLLLTEGKVEGFEVALRKRNGEQFIGCISARLATSPETGRAFIEGFFQDITEKIAIQKALEEHRMWTNALINASSDLIFLKDAQFRYLLVNKAHEPLFGLSIQDIIGKTDFDFYPTDKAKSCRESDLAALRDGMSSTEEHDPHTGNIFHALKHRVENEKGEVLGIAGVVRDVTEHKNVQEMQRDIHAAKTANQAKSDFMARLSHEIRTPLSAILGFTDVLTETSLDDKQERVVSMLRHAGDSLLMLINDLMDISRVEAGRLVLEPVTFSLEKLLHSVEEIALPHIEAKGLRYESHIHANTPARLEGDPNRIKQVLLNLVTNAVKFTSEGGIQVEAAPDDTAQSPGTLRFMVKDSGEGVAPEHHESIFDNFFQVKTPMSEETLGSGLGLAICKRLVELMGGRIWLESTPGEGAAFYFTACLQVADDAGSDAAPVHRAKARPWNESPASGAMRLLLAEDNPHNRILIEEYLEDTPVLLTMVEDGRTALDTFRAEKFDVVLMDLQMPIMDGYEATRAIREYEQEQGLERTPLLAFSAFAQTGDAEKSYSAGCDGHLTKPIRKQDLLLTLQKYSTGAALEPAADESAAAEDAKELSATEACAEFHSFETVIHLPKARESLVRAYLSDLCSDLESMRKDLDRGELEDIRTLSHQYKGTGGAYGMPPVTELSGLLEQAVVNKRLGEASALLDALARYVDVVEVVFT